MEYDINEQKYTDQENTWASLMAYCNIDEELIEETTAWLKDEQGIMVDDGPTFGQIADYCIKKDKKIWYDDSENIEHDFLMEASKNEYGNWKVVSVCDSNEDTGLYAVAIETGNYTKNGVDNGVVLAIRGSEAQDEQMALDWLVADANFANSDLTLQEKTLNKYIDEELTDLIKEKGYSNLAISGHSLAGYLGFEAAAHLAVSNPFLFDMHSYFFYI